MARHAVAVLAFTALALRPLGLLPGQTPAMAQPSRAAVAAARLPAGATVRAATAGARVTGRVRETGRDTLVLTAPDGATVRLALAAVDTLWRARRATGQGAEVGAILGAVALAAVGVIFAQGLCENPSGCLDDTRNGALGGAILGGVGGAVLGAALGSAARTWRRVYP